MNCGNLTLPNYPKLTSYLRRTVGKDSTEFASLASYIEDDLFLGSVASNNLNIEANPDKAYRLLLKTKAIRTNDAETIRKIDENESTNRFLSLKAKDEAINILRGRINTKYADSILKGKRLTFDKIYNEICVDLGDYVGNMLINIVNDNDSDEAYDDYLNLDKAGKTDEQKSDNINKFFAKYAGYKKSKNIDESSKIKKAEEFIRKYGTYRQYNAFMMFLNLSNTEFVNALRLQKDLLVKSDKEIDVSTADELGTRVEIEDISGNEDGSYENTKDEMSKSWLNNIGEISDFKGHVSDIVKFYLSSLTNLSDTVKTQIEDEDANGNIIIIDAYKEDTNNELGIATFADAGYLMKLLYTMDNITDVESFIEGVKHIAENIPDAKALIQLYDAFKAPDGIHLAYAFMQSFNLTVISKLRAQISDVKEGKPLKAAISNNRTNKKLALTARTYNDVKNLAFNNKLKDAKSAKTNYDKTPTINNLYKYAKSIIVDLTEAEFTGIINDGDRQNNIKRFKSICDQLIDTAESTRKNYREWAKTKDMDNIPESFIDNTANIYTFVKFAIDHIDIPIQLNSFNAEGSRSSDVINRNYLSIINDLIHIQSEDKPTAEVYANQKFKSRQYDKSNILLEHIGKFGINNYGLFRKTGNKYQLTEYAKDMFNVYLVDGLSNVTDYSNALYNSMSDGDYLLSALSYFNTTSQENREENAIIGPDKKPITIAHYLLPIPSDAPKNFVISAPRYSANGLIYKNEDDTVSVNPRHPLAQQYYQIVQQELTDMYFAAREMFTYDKNGNIQPSDLLKNNPDAFYENYHYTYDKQGNKVFYTTKNGHIEPTGQVFKLKRLTDESVTTNYFKDLVGFEKPFDFLYGGSIEVVNEQLVFSVPQRQAIANAVNNFILDLVQNAQQTIYNEFGSFINELVQPADIQDFILNDFLVRDAMYDMFGGNQSFYSKSQNILKRVKHIQGSGKPFGNIDYLTNLQESTKDQLRTGVKVSYKDKNGKTKQREVVLQNTFNAVMITNTVKPAEDYVINNLITMLTTAGLDQNNVDRILKPFRKDAAANDAQSWITFEEWIRRITAAGEFKKYESLIDKLNDDNTSVADLTKEELNNFVQIQKNFYYDLYLDPILNIEVPRQIKNAEFVLIPKLIKGTELEEVYNIMMRNNIHQLNTVETVKVAKHNTLTLWDNTGVSNLEEFEKGIEKLALTQNIDKFTYNHLYRQQEVPQHTVDAQNKAAIQIMKKILDNLDPDNEYLNNLKNKIMNDYVANIEDSFIEVCTELGIKLDKDGNIEVDENGEISFDKTIFFERFKENAARQDVSDAVLEHFELDEHGNSILPLFTANISDKLESIANSYFNNRITRQLIDGWHAAQLSDFGFNKLADKSGVKTSKNLKYKVCSTVDEKGNPIYDQNKTVVYSEIYLPKWSKQLENVNLNDWYNLINKENPTAEEQEIIDNYNEILTMVGYRIPTEGKQSVLVLKVVPYPGSEDGFLPSSYGSTVVVPHEFVHQTGADFDIDSVYAMCKTFYYNQKKGTYEVHHPNKFTADLEGYLNYLKTNTNKAGRHELKRYFAKGDNLNEVIEERKKGFNDKLVFAKAESKELNIIAKEYGLLTYEQYCILPDEKRASKMARTNDMIDSFIRILSNPGAYEENSSVSGFDNLMDANKEWNGYTNASKRIVGPSGFLTQLRWFDAATSGIKLKGISVNMDSFASIANVTKAIHEKGITVIYPKGTIDYQTAVDRFCKEITVNGEKVKVIEELINGEKVKIVEVLNNGNVKIVHRQIGHSNDNKNVEGYLINPYSSQTTAHILDVMKEGAIVNENTYTFNAFKAFTLLGSNFDTALGFMNQPAIHRLVKNWKLNNSVLSSDYGNPIIDTLREYGIALGMHESKVNVPLDDIVRNIGDFKITINDKEITINEYFSDKYGISSFSSAFKNGGFTFDREAYKSRLDAKSDTLESILFDILVVGQFNELNNIGQDMSNNVNALKADKYGARPSYFETKEIFNDIKKCIANTNIKVGDITLIESVFPGVEEGINEYLKSNVEFSTYKSLAAFLKYSTATSVKVCEQIFDTASPKFMSYADSYKIIGNRSKINKQEYTAIKNYFIRKVTGQFSNITYLNLPTIISPDGTFEIRPDSVNDTYAANQIELERICGHNAGHEFSCKDPLDPTRDEIIAYSYLTPVEKIDYIKRTFTNINYFRFIETVSNDERANKAKKFMQYLNFNQGNATDNDVHNSFEDMFTHPNPLIKLAALDCVKYAYLIEGNSFGATKITRSVNNTPMYPIEQNGLGIGDVLKSQIRNVEFHNEDIINFVRTNPSAFKIAKYTFNSFKRKGIKYNTNNDGSIKIYSNAHMSVDNHPEIISINKNLYKAIVHFQYINRERVGQLTYVPLNKLEPFETNAGIDDSIFIANNTFRTYRNQLWRQRADNYVHEKLLAAIATNVQNAIINSLNSNGEIEIENIKDASFANRIAYDYNVTGLFKSGVKNNQIYVQELESGNRYFVTITGEKAINISDEMAEMIEKYPNANINDFSVICRITEDDFNAFYKGQIEADNDSVLRYSEDMVANPTSEAIRETITYISDSIRTGDSYAQKIMNKFTSLNIDPYNLNQLATDKELSLNIIYDYIDNEGSFIMDSINHFPCEDGIERRIDSDEVIQYVMKDKTAEALFLKTILSAATFMNKYKLFNLIDVNSESEAAAKVVNKINNISRDINSHNVAATASKKWLMEFVAARTTDPRLVNDITKIFTGYGDTGWADLWIQDIHASKDPIVQNILKEFEIRLEDSRKLGIKLAKDFSTKIKELSDQAKAEGKEASLNSIIDNEGRLIREHNAEWELKVENLASKVTVQKARYGENSVEHLKAKYDYDKFIADTAVHKFKTTEVIYEDGTVEEIDYQDSKLAIEKEALENIPNEFSNYKKILAQISEIYNKAIGNVLTDEQELLIGNLITELDAMTNMSNEDSSKKVGRQAEIARILNNHSIQTKNLRETFFTYTVAPGFEKKLDENLKIIARYETRRNIDGSLIINRDQLMNIEEYAKAKQWIRNNAKLVRNNADSHYKHDLSETLGEQYKKKSLSTVAIQKFDAKDEYGIVDGRKIPQTGDEHSVEAIREQTINNFKSHLSNGLPYGGLIRAASSDDFVYTKAFWENLNSGRTISKKEADTGQDINAILENHWNNETGVLKTWELDIDELEVLKDLFKDYVDIRAKRKGPDGKTVASFIDKHCDVDYAWDAFNFDYSQILATRNKEKIAAWKSVFITVDEETGVEHPNDAIYSVIRPKNVFSEDVDNKWVNKDMTIAKRENDSRFIDVPTPYYWMEVERQVNLHGAKSKEYKDWYKKNHYWNPYLRRYVPLRIWTMKEDNINIYDNKDVKWEPRNNNLIYTEKEELLNKDTYKSGIAKYKPGTGYDNERYTSLNIYQKQMIDEVTKVLNGYVITNSNQRYVDKGYVPALRQNKEIGLKDAPKEIAKFFGYWGKGADNFSWKNDEDVTYDRDYTIPNQSLIQLSDSKSKEIVPIPKFKIEGETDEAFAERVNKAIEANAAARRENNQNHAALINRDWDNVFEAFIKQSAREQAVSVNKNLLYAMDNFLQNTESYVAGRGKLRKDKRRSGQTQEEYEKTSRTNTSLVAREYIRRVVFQQFKNPKHNNLNIVGNLAQNIAGSKYMMMNITGGIANVLTGSTNTFMERMAGEYVSHKDWLSGQAKWLKGSISFVTGLYSETSSTLEDAVIKAAKIIDFDRLVELEAQGANKYINRAKALTYSPQTATEHYMQSTMLFAMMESHRVVETSRGIKVMDLNLYTREVEEDALLLYMEDKEELRNQWDVFNEAIDADKARLALYDTFQRNRVYDFILQYLDKNGKKEYKKLREDMLKESKKEFEKSPTVWSQFELVDGYAQLKSDAILTDTLFSGFCNKVKEVNKKVHGVYDKIGAARIEHHWWGGMVMQYHKHLYPGFKKRYRTNVYYNEVLETIEKGSYISLVQFIATPFRNSNNGKPQDFNEACEAIKEIAKEALQFYGNVLLNYDILPENEKANIRRAASELICVITAICAAIVICGLGDDDDDSIFYNLAMYQVDRLATETMAFNPIGAYAEADKLWSSPVAFQQTITDAFKTFNLCLGLLAEDNFENEYTTGRYKGLNKFEVLLIRNTPIVRSINRILEMPKHNTYYKVQQNALGLVNYRAIADKLFN